MEKIIIIQPNNLRKIDDLVTPEEFKELMDTSLTSLQSVPLIMPEANQESLVKSGISLERLELCTLSETEAMQTLTQLASVYAKVFAGEPWNEVSRCNKTGKFFPEQPGKLCPCCQRATVDAYPLGETMQYITGELSKPNATCMVVKDKEAIVGASWGYVYENTTQFAKDKYPPEMENDIKNAMQQVDITDKFFYMSESFILPIQDDQGSLRYRGKGIVNAFYQMFVMEAQLLGLPMIGRTTADSIQVNKALKNFGFENIFGPTNTADRRQTRIAQNKFVTGKDQQNPTRILYAIGGRR